MWGPFSREDREPRQPKSKPYECTTCGNRYDTVKSRREHFNETGHNSFTGLTPGARLTIPASKQAARKDKKLGEEEAKFRRSLPRTEHEQRGNYDPTMGRREDARYALDHPIFKRKMEKRDKRKETLLTVPVTPKEPKPEKSRNRLAEDMADQELAQTRKEAQRRVTSGTIVPETPESLREDAHNHLIFRRHSYLPTLGVHLPVGAYGRDKYGMHNMTGERGTRN